MPHMDEGRLQAWLDGPRGGLSDEERSEIAGHLAGCDTCAARLEALRSLDAEVEAALAGVEARDGEIPDFETVRMRAGNLGMDASGADGSRTDGPARAGGRSGGGAGGRGSSPRRRLAPAWAATIVVALGAGWLWNEMVRTGMEPEVEPPGVRQFESAGRPVEGDGDVEAGADGEKESALSPDISIPPPPAVASPDPAADTPPNRSRAGGEAGWRPVSAGEAEDFAGFRPRTVPGLPVASTHVLVRDGPAAPVVRTVQRLEDGGGRLVLLESGAGLAREEAVRLATLDGAVEGPGAGGDLQLPGPAGRWIRGWGSAGTALSADSLASLLGRLR